MSEFEDRLEALDARMAEGEAADQIRAHNLALDEAVRLVWEGVRTASRSALSDHEQGTLELAGSLLVRLITDQRIAWRPPV